MAWDSATDHTCWPLAVLPSLPWNDPCAHSGAKDGGSVLGGDLRLKDVSWARLVTQSPISKNSMAVHTSF